MKIRKYQEKDEKQVKNLINEVLSEFFGKTLINEWEEFNDYTIFYVVEDTNKIIGSAALKDEGNGTVKIKRMYVYKEYRKQGIGQKLVDKLFEFAKKEGFRKIVLSTHPKLESAFRFYQKNGFRVIKHPDFKNDYKDLMKEDVDLNEVICMEKKL